MYTVIQGTNGPRFKKDARFVKKADIPADILIKLEVGMLDVNEIPPEPEIHTCIFCGMATKGYRLLNSSPVYLCTDDYYDKTLGQVAQQLRRKEAVNG